MTVGDLLDLLEESLDDAFVVPLTGRRVVNADRVRELIEEMRANFPKEFKKAREITQDRDLILDIATQKADEMVRQAEKRGQKMINSEEIVKKSQLYAREITTVAERKAEEIVAHAKKDAESLVKTAQQQSAEMRQNAFKLSEQMLKNTEEALGKGYAEVKHVRQALLEKAKGRQ